MAPYAEDMSDVPTAPLVLLEERSYQGIYGSVDELIGDIEAIDVQNDRCPVFDAEGRHLVLTAESDDGPITAILDSDRSAGGPARNPGRQLARSSRPISASSTRTATSTVSPGSYGGSSTQVDRSPSDIRER